MLTILAVNFTELPFQDPVLKFLTLLVIILFAPLLLNKIKVPHLLGLIIAGAIIGPNGFNILTRDSNIVVTGTTGLLYIMFLAGLEIDLAEFKKNKWKSLGFGMYTFIIPLAIGYLGGVYLLNFSPLTSILLASLFSSHTLISYPIASKLGITKNRAVNVAVGGTMITDVLALLVLAVVVGVTQGEVNTAFWIKMSVSLFLFGGAVLFGFPIIGRWFFKKVDDKISQYIFVLVMIYFASLLAEIAGVEAIIGAFLAGLALNRLIPHSSALMNRVEFVGNAIFIPFFLISVGMLIDFSVFFKDLETIKVAVVMTVIAMLSKFLAAYFTQKSFKFNREERGVIFGLSSAQAAATLAAVMVGYNIILSETPDGQPVRLLSESVLNGSILMILVSCTISSFVTQKSAAALALKENESIGTEDNEEESILMAVTHQNTIEKMLNAAILMKSKNNTEKVFALNVVTEKDDETSDKNADKLLEQAVKIGASADVKIQAVKRFDTDILNGINNVIKEKKVTDLLIGVDTERGFSSSFIYNLYNGYLTHTKTNVFVYHAVQPVSTVKKYIAIIPENAEKEPGFFYALVKIWNIAKNSGATISFWASSTTISIIENIRKKANIEAEFNEFKNWREVFEIHKHLMEDEGLILVMAKRGMISFQHAMNDIPSYVNSNLKNKNYFLMYPYMEDADAYEQNVRDVNNIEDFRKIGNLIGKIFR